MRTFIALISIMFCFSTLKAYPERRNNSLDVLKQEVIQLFQKNADGYTGHTDEDVTVGFLINANREVIILDVNGDSNAACEFVKQVINYRRIKYDQAKQLTRYTINIHLVSDKN